MKPYRSKAHNTVFAAGVVAAQGGKPRKPPYEDRRCGPQDNIVTGARGYIKAWLAGFDSVKEPK